MRSRFCLFGLFWLALPVVLLSGCVAMPPKPATQAAPTAAALVPNNDPWERLSELPWPQGGQTKFASYDDARRVFWRKLYPGGGTELYCGIGFDGQRKTEMHEALSIEHAFPADAIAETEPGCTNRQCRAGRIQRAMADLQNLWPAVQRVNSSRSRLRFGIIDEDVAPRFPDFCPAFRRSTGRVAVVEPRDEIKGDLARSLVYMHFVYGLPLENAIKDKDLLIDWMNVDPPDEEEMRRNVLIDHLQGAPNPLLSEAFAGM